VSVPIERRRDLLHIMFAAPKDSLRLSPLFHAPSRQVLERCDIDFNRETIHLRVTKNSESRYVPMTGEMRQLLERMKAQRGCARKSRLARQRSTRLYHERVPETRDSGFDHPRTASSFRNSLP
jgi:hypothetical protein